MSRRLHLILTLTALAMSPNGAGAQNLTFENSAANSALIELYTSEGCSSCPPAEAWLSAWKSSPDLWKSVFPVAFHITYWDDLGWTDSFARPAFTQRQRDYAARLGQDSVYTPEFIVDGHEWRGWFHGESRPDAAPATKGKLALTVLDAGAISALYEPAPSDHSTSYTLNIAWMTMDRTSDVAAGENAGRTLHHDFLATTFQSVPMKLAGKGWSADPVGMDHAQPPDGVVAWVSTPEGEIVQVAGGKTSR